MVVELPPPGGGWQVTINLGLNIMGHHQGQPNRTKVGLYTREPPVVDTLHGVRRDPSPGGVSIRGREYGGERPKDTLINTLTPTGSVSKLFSNVKGTTFD